MMTVTKSKRKNRSSLASAVVAGCDISSMFRPPRRMKISDAVRKYMRVPRDAGNSVVWESTLTPYVVEAMNCLSSRSYDAVVFVAPA
ncbi:phage terminase large subunit family protein, partial [Salmonella enterica]|nr:phage terminase large subunit family protein [Salmonella enterica]EGF0834099.1 phage terminase large subunit family protein [Salmonella enterica]EGJ6866265.1 phage terminase large subunit family protein [Salmonella enterica]EIC4780481.1 phage terminase large subunit family protein [Salmonella enterica]